MGKTKIAGQKPGINEHPEIHRDFGFAHGNEHACPRLSVPEFRARAHMFNTHFRTCEYKISLDESRDARKYPVFARFWFCLSLISTVEMGLFHGFKYVKSCERYIT